MILKELIKGKSSLVTMLILHYVSKCDKEVLTAMYFLVNFCSSLYVWLYQDYDYTVVVEYFMYHKISPLSYSEVWLFLVKWTCFHSLYYSTIRVLKSDWLVLHISDWVVATGQEIHISIENTSMLWEHLTCIHISWLAAPISISSVQCNLQMSQMAEQWNI